MTIESLTAELIASFIDTGDFEVRSYSGRGMYGDKCLAVVGNLNEIIRHVMIFIATHETADDNDKIDFIEVVTAWRTDNMGYSTVVYWPGLSFIEE